MSSATGSATPSTPPSAGWTDGASRSAKVRNDLLGEGLELPLRLVPGHESLVKEPAEPFQFAPAPVEGLQRFDLRPHLLRRPGQRVLDAAQALHRQFLDGQQGRRRILRVVLGGAEGLPEAEATEVFP